MDLREFLNELAGNRSLLSYNENEIKQIIILPLFQLLGWNTLRLQDVTPEYSLQSRRVDYALLSNEKPKVFVEVKRPSVSLDNGLIQEQLLTYSFRGGVRLSVLTNGVNWWFYLPFFRESYWERRKYFSINILDQNPEELVERFEDFLSKNSVISGEAERKAEQLLVGQSRVEGVAATLPNAWKQLLGEPDEQLLELLKDKVENLSGYLPTPDELMDFISQVPEFQPHVQTPDEQVQDATGTGLVASTSRSRTPNQEMGDRVGQEEMFHEILKVLQQLDGKAPKRRVEDEIFNKYRSEFTRDWYQEPVSHGVPRWKHNIAWAKEKLKHEGLIKRPAESGRGIWELTKAGRERTIP